MPDINDIAKEKYPNRTLSDDYTPADMLITAIQQDAFISGYLHRQPEVDALIKKYKQFVDNIEWHISTNKPAGEALHISHEKKKLYEEILNDLTALNPKP